MSFHSAQSENLDETVAVRPARISDEQSAIIYCGAPIVVGQAFAGTGKSTTGIHYAFEHPQKSILVLCFNAANAWDAQGKYPKNAKVMTTHSLAYQRLGPKQRVRVVQRWSSVTLRNELALVGDSSDAKNYRKAAIVHSLLTEFFMSPEAEINGHLHGKHARRVLSASDASIESAIPLAWNLWRAMNHENTLPGGAPNTIAIPHDAYLKMFVMREENLGFDTVIFDEAQDANPIMLKLLENQYKKKNLRSDYTKVIYLGDRHQAIYEFRGAVNAMENLPDNAVILPLTQSWRFGKKTAESANRILGELKNEKIMIVGMGQDIACRVGDPVTYIARTNAELLRRAIGISGEGVHWVGGVDSYRVQSLEDVWDLKGGRVEKIKDAYIKKHFSKWEEFVEAAKFDPEAKILNDLVNTYTDQIPDLVKDLRNNAVTDPVLAQLTLTTAHKSKGMEWNNVAVADDFRGVLKTCEDYLSGKNVVFPEAEVNLSYVSVTRARHSLEENGEMKEWVAKNEHYRSLRQRVFNPLNPEGDPDPYAQAQPHRHHAGQLTPTRPGRSIPIFTRATRHP